MKAVSQSMWVGVIFMLAAAMSWGGMFPVAKSLLPHVDAFGMTFVRYGVTALIMAAILWWREGCVAFRAEGGAWRAFLFGSIGFCGFSMLVFSGLKQSAPAHGAILVALMPLITVLVNALLSRQLPPWFTVACIFAALFGVGMVVSEGQPAALWHSTSATGDLMILGGVLSWVVYTLGARTFAGWSALRYSTITVLWGFVGIVLCCAVALSAGATVLPTAGDLLAGSGQLAYIVIFASVLGVLGWNMGVQRLGPINGVLFINLVPITAFAVQAFQGVPLTGWEVGGGAMVVVALLVNNAMQRRSQARAMRLKAA